MKKEKDHLPVYGVGPIYGFCIILATVIAVALTVLGLLPAGRIDALKIPFIVIGIITAVLGFWVWKTYGSMSYMGRHIWTIVKRSIDVFLGLHNSTNLV